MNKRGKEIFDHLNNWSKFIENDKEQSDDDE